MSIGAAGRRRAAPGSSGVSFSLKSVLTSSVELGVACRSAQGCGRGRRDSNSAHSKTNGAMTMIASASSAIVSTYSTSENRTSGPGKSQSAGQGSGRRSDSDRQCLSYIGTATTRL